MRRVRRDAEAFSMSFLDCICCGFGAVILLLVVTEYGDPVRLEFSKEDLQKQVERDEADLFQIRGNSIVLEEALRKRVAELRAEQSRQAQQRGERWVIEGP